MDQNNVIGYAEGYCSSSESGWTKYISSPVNDRRSEADGYGEEEDDDGNNGDQEDGDSVASDASTGELLHQSQNYPWRSGVDEDGDDSDHTRDGEMVKEQPNLKVSARKEEDARFSAHLDDHSKVKRDSNC